MRISRLLSEWIDGIAAGFVAAAAATARKRRYRLAADGRRFVVSAVEGTVARPVGTLERAGEGFAAAPAGLERSLAGARIDIVAPAGAVIVRRLDPLPAESRGFVSGIVRHQLDRLVPWRPADVLYDAATAPGTGKDGRIAVTVTATLRPALAGAIAAAEAVRPAEVFVVADGVDGASPIAVTLGEGADRSWRYARAAAMGLAVGFVVLCIVDVGWTVMRVIDTDRTLGELDQAIADRRAVLKAAADNAGRGDGPPTTLDELKQRSPVAVVALEAMSRTLPIDAYLTEMRLEGGKLRLIGVSRNVADLVPLIEDSDYFSGAAFFAPTVRTTDGGDRFSIEAAVEPRTEIAP